MNAAENLAAETSYIFQIMGNLAAAKAANNADAILECIDDLDCLAMHSETPFIAERAALEAAQASQLVNDLLGEKMPPNTADVVLAFARPAAPLN